MTARSCLKFLRQSAFVSFESGFRNKPASVSFFLWPALSDAIRAKLYGSVEEAIDADALILDDVGSDDDPFKESADKLCQILSRREKKFTLITTNIEQVDWCEKFDGRIVDRFMRNSVVVNLGGAPSYALR